MRFLQPHYHGHEESLYAQIYDVKIEMDRGPRFEAVQCPACGSDIRGFFSPPAQLILKKGVLPDALYFSDLYVSERFRSAWEAEGLTGIEAFASVDSVRMLGRKKLIEDRYYLVVPAASNALLDIFASKCVSSSAVTKDDAYLEELHKRCVVCEACGKVRVRRHSGKLWEPAWEYPEKWVIQGGAQYDLLTLGNAFNGYGPTYILSERFLEFVKKYKLTNVFALTEEELRVAQQNPYGKNAFLPVYIDLDAENVPPPNLKELWRETDCAGLECRFGSFILRDVLDDHEEFCVKVQAREGSWRVWFAQEDGGYILLRHVESEAVPSERIGTIGLDAGALYLRVCGKDKRAEKRIRDTLMEMGLSPVLEKTEKIAASCRRGVAAAFLRTQSGDGDYEVYVDDTDEASSINIKPL